MTTESDPMYCGKLANYRIDFVSSIGQDHAFACQDHLGTITIQVLNNARQSAARVVGLPGSSDEPCELGVE